jgi:hypothetical protein
MIRCKLLLVAAALLTATLAARPAASQSCILRGLCRPCPITVAPQQPCKYNPCTGEYICGTCTDHCVPPPV